MNEALNAHLVDSEAEDRHACPGKATPPCKSCPWRIGVTATDIPNFSLELAEGLARTCPDANGMGPDIFAPQFACHQSRIGEEFPCAGWLASAGHAHPAVRLAVCQGRLSMEALTAGHGWPALHGSYEEVLDKLRATTAHSDVVPTEKQRTKDSANAMVRCRP